MKPLFILLFVSVLLAGCQEKERTLSLEAKNYLDEVLTLLETKSANRKEINWSKLRADVFTHAGSATHIEDTHPSVIYALKLLKDTHSSFKTAAPEIADSETEPKITTTSIPDNIGYIPLGSCPKDEDEIEMYRQQIIQQIITQDKRNVKAWIIDLRGNNAGAISPMLAAIAPVLGNGTVGYFIGGDNAEPWISENGKIFYGSTLVEDIYEFHKLRKNMPAVAVLTDQTTRNSGEAIAVAFKGRPNTKSFGTKTQGHSFTSETYTLSDASVITFTTSIFADRNKQLYKNGVTPDQESTDNEIITNALTWLKQQH